MKKIGITQRVKIYDTYGERWDCLDQNWSKLLACLGYLPVPLCNVMENAETYLESLALDGFIMSGGNDVATLPDAQHIAPERDSFEDALIQYVSRTKQPLLGVCRGMQYIVQTFGGNLEKRPGHTGKRHTVIWQENNFGISSQTSWDVNSYHNYVIPQPNLPECLKALAVDKDGAIEAFQHQGMPIMGIMWHPERESPLQERDLHLFRTVFEGSI